MSDIGVLLAFYGQVLTYMGNVELGNALKRRLGLGLGLGLGFKISVKRKWLIRVIWYLVLLLLALWRVLSWCNLISDLC